MDTYAAPSATKRWIELLPELQAQVESGVASLTGTDLRGDSLCAGWSRAHVLTHLARNADALVAVIGAALDGTGGTMYASSAARDADIEAGANRSAREIQDDLAASAQKLAAALARLSAQLDMSEPPVRFVERTPGGQVMDVLAVPFLRARELTYHHVDLLRGFTFADLPPEFVGTFLADERLRLEEDPTGSQGRPPVGAAPADELAYLARGHATNAEIRDLAKA